jgi:hypothetical protein
MSTIEILQLLQGGIIFWFHCSRTKVMYSIMGTSRRRAENIVARKRWDVTFARSLKMDSRSHMQSPP